jgi:diacylglycerol kinase family enzyme
MRESVEPNNGTYVEQQQENHFKRVVVLYNPKSTRVKQFDYAIGELLSSGVCPEFKIIETDPDSQVNIDTLVETLKEGDALVVWGGDGTGNDAANALLDDEIVDLKIPLLYLWGGNGIDKARQTNGHLSRLSPSEALRTGNIEPINPLLFSYGDQRRIATAYGGVGTIAELTKRLNDKEYRSKPFHEFAAVRLLREARVLQRYYPNLEEFTIEDEDGEHTLHELIFTNGSRIAKFGRFMLRLNEPRFFKTALEKKEKVVNGQPRIDHVHIATWLARLMTATSKGEYIGSDDGYDFETKTPVKVHFDGEYDELPAGTRVRVTQDSRSIHVISTRF